jgi:hypothetical protein
MGNGKERASEMLTSAGETLSGWGDRMLEVLPSCFAIASAWSKSLQITLTVAAICMVVPSEITLDLCGNFRYDPHPNISDCRWMEYKVQYPFAMLKQNSYLMSPECFDSMPAEIPLCDGQCAKVFPVFVMINIVATVYTLISLVMDLSCSGNCCHIIKGAVSNLDLLARGVLMLAWLASGILYVTDFGKIHQCIYRIKQQIRYSQERYYWCEKLSEDYSIAYSISLILFAISFGLWAAQFKLALAIKAFRSKKTDSTQSPVVMQVQFDNFDSNSLRTNDKTVLCP